MREKTYHLYLNEEERSRVIQSLIELKNNLAAQGRYTDAVDDVLCKVLGAKKISKPCWLSAARVWESPFIPGCSCPRTLPPIPTAARSWSRTT